MLSGKPPVPGYGITGVRDDDDAWATCDFCHGNLLGAAVGACPNIRAHALLQEPTHTREAEDSKASGPGAVDSRPREKPLVYLACPYSHPERAVRVERFEAVNRAAAGLMSKGLKIFSPISHTHPIAEAGALPLGWEFWADFDRAYLSHCQKMIVLRLDGWDKSTGVQAEIKICAELGVPVEYMDQCEAAGG